MMGRMRHVFLLALLLVASSLFAAPVEHVVIVSMDGARPDMILSCETPNIRALAAGGSFTWHAQTINPSSTLPSHTSMLTGCQPAKHGTTFNSWRKGQDFVNATTCFEIAHQAGLKTAMFVGKSKLQHIAKPGTVDEFLVTGGADVIAKTAAEHFLEVEPGLMFVHFVEPDAAGHAHGWGDTPEYRASIEACDKAVGVVFDAIKKSGLEEKTLLIVTADHGGHRKTHGSLDARDMTIPWAVSYTHLTLPTN